MFVVGKKNNPAGKIPILRGARDAVGGWRKSGAALDHGDNFQPALRVAFLVQTFFAALKALDRIFLRVAIFVCVRHGFQRFGFPAASCKD